MATEKKPKIERSCLVCDIPFMGTPKATRCQSCKDAGLKVPSAKQPKRRTKACITCGTRFPVADADELQCASCTARYGISQFDLTPEQEAARRIEEQAKRWRGKMQDLRQMLDRSHRPPKGYPKMKRKLADSLIGCAWLEVVHRDGAAHALSSYVQLDTDTKVKLLSAFHRMRLKGYRAEAIAQLCPVHLMSFEEATLDDALRALPRVDIEVVSDESFASQEDHSAALEAVTAEQDRQATAIQLGLTAPVRGIGQETLIPNSINPLKGELKHG